MSVAREIAPAGGRSTPKSARMRYIWQLWLCRIGVAAQPSGSKLPRHKGQRWSQGCSSSR
ncbi:hypothetical protein C1893_08385 [Pseudomonas sp. MPR-ANC1]|nr:hypothetical protein C1893_08385 [Pseudomonas sp. MPR-ANC1]